MVISGGSLSLFGRSALSNVGGSRVSMRQALDPVNPTDPLKDPTSNEYKELQDLKTRDREVRQHEQAHVAAGGAHVAGGPTFSYTRGPDGRQYATGGEVPIDDSPVPGDPEATIRKMQTVQSAALAPAEPSAQDRAVAAKAAQAENQARVELREQQTEERQSADEDEAAEPQRAKDALRAYRGAAEDSSTPLLDLIA